MKQNSLACVGSTQQKVLDALVYWGSWPGKWVWSTPYRTRQIMESLRKKGLVTYDADGKYRVAQGSGVTL